MSNRIFILSPGSCSKGGTWGQNLIPAVCLSVMLSPPKPLEQCRLGHVPGVGLGGTGGQNFIFFQILSCGISN